MEQMHPHRAVLQALQQRISLSLIALSSTGKKISMRRKHSIVSEDLDLEMLLFYCADCEQGRLAHFLD